eukprot:574320-Amorphochlora_amoeboformis.AAC.1
MVTLFGFSTIFYIQGKKKSLVRRRGTPPLRAPIDHPSLKCHTRRILDGIKTFSIPRSAPEKLNACWKDDLR